VGPERDVSPAAGGGEPAAYPAYPEPESRPARPPLTKRMRPGQWIALDCAVALFAALGNTAVASRFLPSGQAKFPVALVFAALVFLPVALRRRAPVPAFAALLILGVAAAGLSPALPAAIFLAAAYVLYTVTVETRRRTGAAALALVLAVMVGLGIAGARTVGPGAARTTQVDPGLFLPVALACVIAWMTGYSVRQRRRYVVTLQQQAASSAVAEERLRIARELHDVVAHSMSVIAVQAGYGQYVIDNSPDGAKEALGAIQATSRDALDEMRRMLGVLRQQDAAPGADGAAPAADGAARITLPGAPAPGLSALPGYAGGPMAPNAAAGTTAGRVPGGASANRAPLSPAPGLAALDRLVSRTRGAGVRVTLEVSGQARPAPAGVDLSAFRIIQEALTNVVRHAGTGAACVVGLGYTDADLVIRVTDDGGRSAGLGPAVMTTVGTGHGIIGMRERVHLCGGTFGAGPRPDGGFEVTAALPLPVIARSNTGASLTAGPGADGPGPVNTGAAPSLSTAVMTALTEGRSDRG
jgi:signal transduction histidine kinase